MIKGFPTRKDSIILAAIDIINEGGIQNLSTKRIAEKQDISESLLYRHFKSLDDVLVAVIKYFSRFDSMIANTVEKKEIPYKEKIIEHTKAFVELYESYPALVAVLLNYETLIHYEHTRKIIIDIIEKRVSYITRTIKQGQDTGEISDYYTEEELTDTINGIIISTTIRWKMTGYNFGLKDAILTTIKKVLDRC